MPFLRNYMAFTEGSEVPANYHFWSGLYSLACIVNRQVWLNMGQFNIYPNLYVILLGPPGNGKSLAMDTAQVLIEDVGGILTSGDAQTKESLAKYMMEECQVSITIAGIPTTITPIAMFATELSHLLGVNSAHMIDFLTTIYSKDKRYITRTKNKGNDIIERPFVGLIACTTQEWINTYLKSDIIGGGFTRRAIFVNEPLGASVSDKSLRKPFLIVTPEHVRARENVLAYAAVLRNISGEFQWAPEAKHAYEHWYMTRDIPRDPDTVGYHKTKPVQVLKVAMLLALSEGTDLRLTKDHFTGALALFEKTEVTLTRVFQGIGRNELNAIAFKALDIIKSQPCVDFKDNTGVSKGYLMDEKLLRAQLNRDAPSRECDEIINHLIASEQIFRFQKEMRPEGKAMYLRTFLGVRALF